MDTGIACMKSIAKLILERKLYSMCVCTGLVLPIHRVTSCATSSCLLLPGSVIDAAYVHTPTSL